MAVWDRRSKFDRMLREHLSHALQLAVRLTGDMDQAEDVVQDAMVRASRSWKTYRGDSLFRSWFYRIVVNAFRDQVSRNHAVCELIDEPIDTKGQNPAELAITHELGERVAAEISALPARQREVLVFSAFEAMDVCEIAALLQISEKSVYSNLHLARTKLKRRLAQYLAEN